MVNTSDQATANGRRFRRAGNALGPADQDDRDHHRIGQCAEERAGHREPAGKALPFAQAVSTARIAILDLPVRSNEHETHHPQNRQQTRKQQIADRHDAHLMTVQRAGDAVDCEA
jgi:hypothetical protein